MLDHSRRQWIHLKKNKKDHRKNNAMVLHFPSGSREISFRLDGCPPGNAGSYSPSECLQFNGGMRLCQCDNPCIIIFIPHAPIGASCSQQTRTGDAMGKVPFRVDG
jgi:hypothetical protein